MRYYEGMHPHVYPRKNVYIYIYIYVYIYIYPGVSVEGAMRSHRQDPILFLSLASANFSELLALGVLAPFMGVVITGGAFMGDTASANSR
jgi:polyferredoxin